MNKILEGMKEAVKVAKCDHNLIVQPRLSLNTVLERFFCTKCKATLYKHITSKKGRR